MNSDPILASQAASLRAGVFAVVMIVVVCFGAAFMFSDPSNSSAVKNDEHPPAAGAETVRAP